MSHEPDDTEIIVAMERCGGSFIKALANAWRHADATNKQILKDAFPEYWASYRKYAERTKDDTH